MKNAFRSKTLWFNMVVMVLFALQVFDVVKWIPEEILVQLTAIVNFILRLLTNQPITFKNDTGN